MSDNELIKKSGLVAVNEDDDGSGSSGGIVKPKDGDLLYSSLKEETEEMENERRALEQSGHRKYAKINARDRTIEKSSSNEAGMEMKQHPLLQNSQRYDGISPDLNPAPLNNPDARAEFENHIAEQKLQKELRLGNKLDQKHGNKSTPTLTR